MNKQFIDIRLKNRIIDINSTIIQALSQMDKSRVKMLFVFNISENKFIGILTIGDIQRAIIKNKQLTNRIDTIIENDKEYAYELDDISKIKQYLIDNRSECMPVLNEDGQLVNVYYWEDFFPNKTILENRKQLNIPVVIMAGGLGTRLKPLTNVLPKPLIPIGEKTIIETIMDKFQLIGCNDFYLSVNYKSEIIKYYFSQLNETYNIQYFQEDKPLGTIGSVALLKDKIKTPFFVSNCDIIVEQDYRDVYEYHRSNKNDITIVSAVKNYSIPYGVIKTEKDGILDEIREKPDMTYLINTGIYILNSELIKEIPENTFFHITDLINKVKLEGGRIGCFPVSEGSWIDMGDWNEYLKVIK